MALQHYKKLVLVAAHTLYCGPVQSSEGGKDRHDTTGVANVVLHALTRRQWVKEKELAADLKVADAVAVAVCR